jgi:hypothetical protein
MFIIVDALSKKLISMISKWDYLKIITAIICDGRFFYSNKSKSAMTAIPAMNVSICMIACQVFPEALSGVKFSLWSSGIRSDPAI